MSAMKKDEANGGAFNLGTGAQTRIIDLARTILELCASRSQIDYAPRRVWDKSLRREADISRARATLGLAPKTTVREGLERTIAWFREDFSKIERSTAREGVAAGGIA